MHSCCIEGDAPHLPQSSTQTSPQAGLVRAEAEASSARDAHRLLELRAAGLQRRVDRARQGGRQVAVEAEVMYQELSGAREFECV